MKPCLLLFLLLCGLGGCLSHSIGPAEVKRDASAPHAVLERDQAVFVTTLTPLPPDAGDSAEYIAAQFAKYLRPVARETRYGAPVADAADGLAKARDCGCGYLVLLRVLQWKASSLFSPGHAAEVEISVMEVDTGALRDKSTVSASCWSMLASLEQSTRECLRPQVNTWLQQTFNTDTVLKAHTNPGTFSLGVTYK